MGGVASAVVPLGDGGVDLTEWDLLGPLPLAAGADVFSADGATFLGTSEAALVGDGYRVTVEKLRAGPNGSWLGSFLRREADTRILAFNTSYGLDPGWDDVPPMVVYASSVVSVEADRTAYLLLGSSNGARVWLNGELVLDTPVARGVFTYDDVVPVALRAGENEFMFRVSRTRSTWGLVARLEPTLASASAEALEGQRIWQATFLEHPDVRAGEPLIVGHRSLPDGYELSMRLETLGGQRLDTQAVRTNGSWRLPTGVANGVYRLATTLRGNEHWQWIVVGEPLEAAAGLRERAAKVAERHFAATDRDALLGRIEILAKPEHRDFKKQSERWDWHRRMIFALAELQRGVERAEANQSAYRGVPGLHLRGFVSAIDGITQHYRIYVPRAGADLAKKLPLIVMLPTVVSANRPFLGSVFVASQVEAERIAALAEEQGAVVVWSGYRNAPSGLPVEVAHWREVLAHVQVDTAIDEDRISLMGACSGAALAARLVIAEPERFSGVALLNPSFELMPNLPSREYFEANAAFQEWLKERSGTVDRWLRQGGPACLILHDGGEPGHGELGIALDFDRRARVAGFPAVFERRPQTLSQHFGAWEELMAWAVTHRRENRADAGEMIADTREASIMEVLAEPFVVVQGTQGTAEENAEMARLAEEFREAWQQSYFGACRVRLDEGVPMDEGRGNLVLIGDARLNQWAAAWDRGGAVKVVADHVELEGEVFKDGALAVQHLLTSPDGRQSALVVSGTDLRAVSLRCPDLSVEGWYRSAVWRSNGSELQLIYAGR